MASLKDLEDLDVLSTAVKVTNAGDGLSKAMSVDDVELHHGQIVHVLLECEVVNIQVPQVKDTDGVSRVHVVRAGRATIVDAKYAMKELDRMDRKIEKAAGVNPLPGFDGDND